jgi:hypothetical protein
MVTETLLLKKIRQSEYTLVSSGLPVNRNILLVQLPATKRLSSPIFRYEVIAEYGFWEPSMMETQFPRNPYTGSPVSEKTSSRRLGEWKKSTTNGRKPTA